MRCQVCDCNCKVGKIHKAKGNTIADMVCRNPRCTEYDMVIEQVFINREKFDEYVSEYVTDEGVE